MSRLRALGAAAHPLPTVAVTGLLTVLAAAWGRGPGGTLLVLLMVLTGQLSIGWCNDAVDADRDARAGRSDKPVATGVLPRRAVATAAGVAALACVPLSLASGPRAGLAHLLAVAAGWAYDLGLKSTVWSWVPYAVAFGAFPASVVLGLPGAPTPAWWIVAAGSLLGVGAHAANVLPDLDDDAVTGIRGLPHRLGAAGARALAVSALVAAVLVLALAPPGPLRPAAVGLVVVVLALAALGARPGRPQGDRAPFRAVVAAGAAAVALLVTLPVPVA